LSDALFESLRRADSYLVDHRYRGYDPYDGLTSPIFKLPVIRDSPFARLVGQQLLKRCPVNARPLLGIRRGYNPVTLGLALQAYSYLSVADVDRSGEYRRKTDFCLSELREMTTAGYSGACWGYDFPWQTRDGLFPTGTPTIVATAFVTNGLFTAYRLLGREDAFALCESAADFFRLDLQITAADGDEFCWSYSPLDHSAVLNASAKGARLCAQIYSVTGDEELRSLAEGSLRFVARHQRTDGSWPYSVSDKRTWTDNFHTGYVLDCLVEYERCTGDREFADVTQRGWEYYRGHFFTPEFLPKYYDNKLYPIDSTAVAQSILTLCTFGDLQTAKKVGAWAVKHLQRDDGAFIYQIHRTYRNQIAYVRWSVSWMFCALARLFLATREAS
jgi:hypothetical protein